MNDRIRQYLTDLDCDDSVRFLLALSHHEDSTSMNM